MLISTSTVRYCNATASPFVGWSNISRFHFYEKVIKVKADVAALHIFFLATSTTLHPVAWRAVKGAVLWRSS